MTNKRMTTWQKATALVPLAVLSGAWTASLAVTSAPAADDQGGQLPDGSHVPSQAVKDPANISAPGELAPGVPNGNAQQVIKSASTNGIPSAALAAYQRAAQVLGNADPSCNLQWPLVAAIGRVESDHGRYGGNVLTSKGISRPGIYGPALNGQNGTAKVMDTDAGQYDHDKVYDRAGGPMQFIPSTWAVVGAAGDGDGQRNPQDIHDAALATGVYLCSGNENLANRSGQESAVYRYNHSNDYVNLVLSIADAYSKGDYSAVPNNSGGSTTFSPSYGDSVTGGGAGGFHPARHFGGGSGGSGGGKGGSGGGGGGGTGGSTGGTTGGTSGGGTTGGITGGDTGGTGGTGGGSTGGLTKTLNDTTKKVTDTVKGATGGGGTGGGSTGGSGGGTSLTQSEQCLLKVVGSAGAAVSSLNATQLLAYNNCMI